MKAAMNYTNKEGFVHVETPVIEINKKVHVTMLLLAELTWV